jgi:bifunctional ADP-heptose synthase (sugar kinase/adenylyltransferase)
MSSTQIHKNYCTLLKNVVAERDIKVCSTYGRGILPDQHASLSLQHVAMYIYMLHPTDVHLQTYARALQLTYRVWLPTRDIGVCSALEEDSCHISMLASHCSMQRCLTVVVTIHI